MQRELFRLNTINYYVYCSFSKDVLIRLKQVPSISSLLRDFIINEYYIFFKSFLCIFEMNVQFFFDILFT